MTDFSLITTLRDVMELREKVLEDSQRKTPVYSFEQRTAIAHIVNIYLDDLLAPWTHPGSSSKD